MNKASTHLVPDKCPQRDAALRALEEVRGEEKTGFDDQPSASVPVAQGASE